VSDECWNIIKAAKNAAIQIIRSTGMGQTDSPYKLREDILNQAMEGQLPSSPALAFIKKEARELW